MDKDKSNVRMQIIISVISGIFIIVAAIISSPHWFKLIFPENYVEKEINAPEFIEKTDLNEINEEKEGNSGIENITIERIELCPISSDLSSYFYLKLKNSGTKYIDNLSVSIDFGRSQINDIDIKNLGTYAFLDSSKVSILKIQYDTLVENEVIDIYCLLSEPTFKVISITGSNLTLSIEYSYEQFLKKEQENNNNINVFFIFLMILLGFILFMFSLYIISIVYRLLKKKDLIDWG